MAIPSALRSLFHHRLWRLRDEVIDETIAGRLPREAAIAFARRVETTISAATELTPVRLAAFYLAMRHEKLPEPPKLPPEMKSYEAVWAQELMHQVFTGSPSGWILLPFILALRVGRRHRQNAPGAYPDGHLTRIERDVLAAEEWAFRR